MVKTVDLNKYHDLLEDFSRREFNVLAFSRKVERQHVLPILMINGIN